MKKTRIKVSLPQISTRDEAEALMGDVALVTLNQIRLTARMDAEISAIRQRYESPLAECAAALQQKTETLRAWAEASPEQFPKGRKSLEFVQGTLGFRTGTPKLALLSRAWNWEKVLGAVERLGFQFTRTKVELDKDAVLGFYSAAQDKPEVDAGVLRPMGVKIVQEESFFIDPKLTEVETRQVSEV